MLQRLSVENYALIDRLEMTLDAQLNIITGETGAGKSILLGALGLLLGGKNDGTATRDNTKNCVVEGVFQIDNLGLQDLFEQMDWDYEEQITIRRIITPAGKSRSFVGDIPASLSDLKSLSTRLIDIHSQHKNQVIGDENFRRSTLDLLYDSAPLLATYRESYDKLQELKSELKRSEQIAAQASRDQEWLTHQVEELTAAKLREGESEEAEAELKILENAEMIGSAMSKFSEAMDGDHEAPILVTLRNSEREMRQIAKSYPIAAEYADRLSAVFAELKDMTSSISADAESIEADPQRIAKLSDRIDMLYSLCQKHRAADVGELIEIRDRYASQLSMILGADEHISALRERIGECESTTNDLARSITSKRLEVAPRLANEIVAILSKLGLSEALFRVDVSPLESLSPSGADRVDMLFSAVEGKRTQAIESIASGGEISRIMLAIKSVMAQHTNLPTIIFDEIDTGVSGRIADAMGEIIEQLSTTMQVIVITHLPQVASKGKSHFVVYKEGGRTNIRSLTTDERIDQIATMLSGEQITDAALAQAKILLALVGN